MPSGYVGVKYWEVALPVSQIPHLLTLSVPRSILGDKHYFPMVGDESLGGTIPQGAILHLKSPAMIPNGLSAGANVVAQALLKYGAVISDGNSGTDAFINVEALYAESSSSNWNTLQVYRGSLAGIPIDTTHFEILPKGAPLFGGPTQDQWNQIGACEDNPGG